jgi:hypothetical protein
MTRLVYNSIVTGDKAVDQFDRENQNNMIRELAGEGVLRVAPGGSFDEDQPFRNDYFVSSGKHEGLVITKPQAALWGAAGATVTRQALIKANAFINNIYFVQAEDSSNVNSLVIVSNNARVVFNSCVFQRKYNAPIQAPSPLTTKCFVLVESGSSATFQGCCFRSDFSTGAMNGVGTVVQNANAGAAPPTGPLPGVYIIGGTNLTTHSHGSTVTIIGGEV